MMRLLLTILAALGFVWAALNNAGAQERPATEPPAIAAPADTSAEARPDAPVAAAPASDAAAPRQFGASRKDARVVIEAREEAWVRISDGEGRLVFMRTLKPGETYRVPNRSGLVLDSGNAKGLIVQVDGNPAPAFIGMVRRSIPLDPEMLPQGTFARPRPAPAAPAPTVAAVAEPPTVTMAEPEMPAAPKVERTAEAPSVPAAESAVSPSTEASAEGPATPAVVAAAEPAVSSKPEDVGRLPAAPDVAAAGESSTLPAAAPAIEPPKVAFDAPPLTERAKPAAEQPDAVAADAPAHAAPPIELAPPSLPKAVEKPAAEKPTAAEPMPPRGELLTATLPMPAPRPGQETKPAIEPEIQPAAVIAPASESAPEAAPDANAQRAAVAAPQPMPSPPPKASVKTAAHAPAAKAAAPQKSVAPKSEPAKPAALVAPKRAPVKTDAAKPASLAAPRSAAKAQVAPPPVTGAAAVAPSGVISAAASRIGVEVQKGTLVRLPRPASAVFVADPEVADIQIKSAGLVYIFGKRPGETALFAVDDHERVVLSTTLVVNHNVSRLRQALRAVAPDAAVDVISIDGSLILTGTVLSAAEAENIRTVVLRFVGDKGTIINQLKVAAPNQINLRVRIAEVSKDTLKQFSIDWNSVLNVGSFAFGLATGSFNQVTPANNVLGIRNISSNLDLNVLIDALGTEGLITLLAEPNLTAMSGETASFLAGGEFPIPISYPRDNTITIEFKTFGVGLAFTPHILDNGRINLRVRPEVSQLSSIGAIQLSGFSIPALSTRRAETTVELASGQSFAIAGLLQHNSNQDISKVPLLGDLPVLGALFKSDRFRRNETELVIVVTPYIVRPVSANRIALPTDGFVAPNDVERILGGATYRQQLQDRGEAPSNKEGQGLIGPTGFQLD